MSTRIDQVKDSDPELLCAIEGLYSRAFPSSERKPVQFLTAALHRSDYRVLSLSHEGEFIAFAVLFRSTVEGMALLEYMAVVESARGQGWGSRLFGEVAVAAASPILIELETDGGAGSSGNERTRRKNFYTRLGCRQLRGVEYEMPKIASAEPPRMELLVHGVSAPSLSGEQLGRWLWEIYRNVYSRDEDDPGLRRMRAALPEAILLE